ncbi:histidine ammonia-lyase-like isoform X1 [Branchiostoma floridae x Branchiostoma belcheri]
MKITVKILNETFTVPCKDGSQTIGWLAEETMRRYRKARSAELAGKSPRFQVRRARGDGLLDADDSIVDVLDDNDFVHVVFSTGSPGGSALVPAGPIQSGLHYQEPKEYLALDGNSLTPADLVQLGKGLYKIKLTDDSLSKVKEARKLLENILTENKVCYGINTGFGKFARTVIPANKLVELQENLIRSHSAGVGPPLTPERTRMLFALRINVLAKGYSGVSFDTLTRMIDAFNASCLPWIPEKGTVGASGDLAPLSHLAQGMLGEGRMWSPKTGWGDAKDVLEAHGLKPVKLGPKEGLALINGTQLITSLGAEALERAAGIARQADIVAALTLDVLKGTTRAFDSDIHAARPHKGQNEVARRFRSLLHSELYPSEISESHRFCDRVQDAYTLRCCPQVHGIVNDTIDFVSGIITTEMNSATDNPMVFPQRHEIISGGNFHGEYPAKALDYLAIGVHELASMSERRIERLCNPTLSELPAFLVEEGGLNSGFMIAHCTAASLVSENKVLTHPSSVDSLSTSAATEDHVSMGGFAARKALQVVEHVEQVLAIELLAACQAIEFLRPLHTTVPLEKVYDLVRNVAGPWDKDRFMSPDIDAVTRLLRDGEAWETVKPYLDEYKREVWGAAKPYLDDFHEREVKELRLGSPTSSYLSNLPLHQLRMGP